MSPETSVDLRLHPDRLVGFLLVVTAAVLGLGCLREIVGMVLGLPTRTMGFLFISLNDEQAIPAWWSSTMLTLAGLSMWLCGALERRRSSSTYLGWILLGTGFVYASLDEAIVLHEHFADWVPWEPTGLFRYRWVIVGLPIVAAVGLVFLPFLLRLPRRTALRLIVGGATYVVGSLGAEMLGGALHEQEGYSVSYLLVMMLEETMEMVGVLLGIRAVLLHISQVLGGLNLRLA